MSKSLIIYFSRADENYSVGWIDKGNTEYVAEFVQELTGSDMFRVEPAVPYVSFAEKVNQEPLVDTVYLVTDSDADYRFMSKGISAKHKVQLYRDYLDNFRINSRR